MNQAAIAKSARKQQNNTVKVFQTEPDDSEQARLEFDGEVIASCLRSHYLDEKKAQIVKFKANHAQQRL